MSGKLTGKVALVTGASSGIGAATAIALAEEGAKVVLSARRADRMQEVAERIKGAGGSAIAIIGDVSVEADADRMVSETVNAYGQIDIVVNNAGVMLLGPIADADLEDWRRMININVLGLMYVTHAALPHMKSRNAGHIVNISSTAGRMARAGAGVYNASKWGVGAFSESLRQELHKTKIRVTIIEPGIVATELRDHITNATAKQQINDMANAMVMLEPEDVSASIIYAVTQPERVNVNEILIRPTDQLM